MDDVMVKYGRYPRHAPARRRKKNVKDTQSFQSNLSKQLVISILIFAAIWSIKNFNTPATDYLCEKIRWSVTSTIEIKSIFKDIDSFLNKIKNFKLGSKENNGKEEVLSAYTDLEASNSTNEVNSQSISLEEIKLSPEEINKISQSISPPVKEGTISADFGEETDWATKLKNPHYGIDIETEHNSYVQAVLSGEVVEVSAQKSYGKYIKIKHQNGLTTVYAHCTELSVNENDKVEQGQIIGKVGETGVPAGTHLHFEIWKDQTPLNPEIFFDVY